MRQEKCNFRCILNLDVQTGSGSDQILKTGSNQIWKTGLEHFLNLDPISYKKKSDTATASGSATLDTLKYVFFRRTRSKWDAKCNLLSSIHWVSYALYDGSMILTFYFHYEIFASVYNVYIYSMLIILIWYF